MSNVASETLETEQKIGAQTRPNDAAAAVAGAASPAAATGTAAASKTYPSPHRNTMALKDELVREAHPKNV